MASTSVTVGGRVLTLTNLDRILYPGAGTTKAQVLQYLAAVAPVFLPLLADRPVTRVRWPEGTSGPSFFEKNTPRGTPEWVPRVTLTTRGSRGGSERVTYPLVDDVATLTWLGNLGALELHVHQWRVHDGRPRPPDRFVVDLDPGAPAGLPECARVALLVRDALDGVLPGPVVPVTSGGKGLQLYARAPQVTDPDATRALAEALATRLEYDHPDLVVASMVKARRRGKVLLDWSQNTRAKTTICPYSLRGRGPRPTVAAPRTWAELESAAASGGGLSQLGPDEVLARLDAQGDLTAPLTAPDVSGRA